MTSRPALLGIASIACVVAGFYTGTCAWHPTEPAALPDAGAAPLTLADATVLDVPVATDLTMAASASASRATPHRDVTTVPVAATAAVGGLPALPASVVARRIGLLSDDPRAAVVAEWVSTKLAEDHRAMDALDSAADRDKPARMSEFNAATEARRIELITTLGAELAAKVVE